MRYLIPLAQFVKRKKKGISSLFLEFNAGGWMDGLG
jgi:hypothetical protein